VHFVNLCLPNLRHTTTTKQQKNNIKKILEFDEDTLEKQYRIISSKINKNRGDFPDDSIQLIGAGPRLKARACCPDGPQTPGARFF